jgi:hypothetical protein
VLTSITNHPRGKLRVGCRPDHDLIYFATDSSTYVKRNDARNKTITMNNTGFYICKPINKNPLTINVIPTTSKYIKLSKQLINGGNISVPLHSTMKMICPLGVLKYWKNDLTYYFPIGKQNYTIIRNISEYNVGNYKCMERACVVNVINNSSYYNSTALEINLNTGEMINRKVIRYNQTKNVHIHLTYVLPGTYLRFICPRNYIFKKVERGNITSRQSKIIRKERVVDINNVGNNVDITIICLQREPPTLAYILNRTAGLHLPYGDCQYITNIGAYFLCANSDTMRGIRVVSTYEDSQHHRRSKRGISDWFDNAKEYLFPTQMPSNTTAADEEEIYFASGDAPILVSAMPMLTQPNETVQRIDDDDGSADASITNDDDVNLLTQSPLRENSTNTTSPLPRRNDYNVYVTRPYRRSSTTHPTTKKTDDKSLQENSTDATPPKRGDYRGYHSQPLRYHRRSSTTPLTIENDDEDDTLFSGDGHVLNYTRRYQDRTTIKHEKITVYKERTIMDNKKVTPRVANVHMFIMHPTNGAISKYIPKYVFYVLILLLI